ncbi:MAG: efflux RND transporter periplasmic adaptor subunit [Chloroflexota bacterium]
MMIFKKRIFWIILVVILALAGGGYYYYTHYLAQSTATTAEPALQTAVARRGDLVITASGTGQVVPAEQISLGFDDSGTLIELNVGVGDQVKEGQVLARLQTKDTPETIAVSISTAELAVLKAQSAIDDLVANAEIARTTALSDIATYSQAVRDAQYQLENYTMPIYLQGMDAIEALDKTKAELDAASAAFEPYRLYPASNDTRYNLLVALNVAQGNYDSAVKRLNYEYELQVAEANLNKARGEYEKYKDGPAADEMAQAQAELENAQASLALAKEAKAIDELAAPMDGTVLSISANVGESAGGTAFITLANLDQPVLEVYLDETDLDKVALGYEADVVFDALPDKTFTGKVTLVSPSLEDVSNVQAVKVMVSLDKESLGSVFLPVGLNASVDVVSGRAMDAVLVPVEALRELDPGEYAVFVEENGELNMRVVEVGLMDVTSAEIKSGLQAGEVVSTGIVQAGN